MEGDQPVHGSHAGEPISIHALRMEGDRFPRSISPIVRSISIHALRMEGDIVRVESLVLVLISIHALRMEGDSCS